MKFAKSSLELVVADDHTSSKDRKVDAVSLQGHTTSRTFESATAAGTCSLELCLKDLVTFHCMNTVSISCPHYANRNKESEHQIRASDSKGLLTMRWTCNNVELY